MRRPAFRLLRRPALNQHHPERATTTDRNATRVQIAGATGQPHHDYPDAGHFIQDDVEPDLARRIVDWIASTPPE